MTLSHECLEALRNLSRKKAGDLVCWIAIAEARALTDLGLARRVSSGWRITPDGEAALSQQPSPASADNVVAGRFAHG
jgi:hypothetical protein